MHRGEINGKRSLSSRETLFLSTVSILMAAGMWYYFDAVGVASQEAEYARRNSGPRGGNLSDLYPPWFGSREILLHQRNPYSKEVTTEIQTGFWGYPGDPRDESRFAYPLFVVFLLAPTVTLPFHSVQLLYMAVCVILSVASVWFWFRVFGERHSLTVYILATALLLGSYPVVQALHNQQLTLLVAGLIASTVAAVAAGLLWLAGVILALSLIKPQAALPIAGWLLLWSVSKWRERKTLLMSFAVTIAALWASAEFLLPGWIWEWREGLTDYVQFTPLPPPQVQLLFGKYIGSAVGVGMLLVLVAYCWRTRRDSPSTDRFRIAAPLILAGTLAVSPIWHAYDHVLLLPAVLLGFQWRGEYFRLEPFGRSVLAFSIIVLAWPWFAGITLLLVSRMSPDVAQSLAVAPLYSLPFSAMCVWTSLILIARHRLSQRAS